MTSEGWTSLYAILWCVILAGAWGLAMNLKSHFRRKAEGAQVRWNDRKLYEWFLWS